MAGIGQQNTLSHTSSWNSAVCLGMGRSMQNETQNHSSSPQQTAEKRSLRNNASYSSSLGGLGSNVSVNYTPLHASSTRLSGLNSAGNSVSSNYFQDSTLENSSMNFMPCESGSNAIGTPQQGVSEPSLLTGVENINHSMSSGISSVVSGFMNNTKSTFVELNKNAMGMGLFSGPVNTSSSLFNSGASSTDLTFDPSDFPPIVNIASQSQSQNPSVHSQYRNYISAISKGGTNSGPRLSCGNSAASNQLAFSASSVQASSEYFIDRDFPALPMAQASKNAASTFAAGVSGVRVGSPSPPAKLNAPHSVTLTVSNLSGLSRDTVSDQAPLKNGPLRQSSSLSTNVANSGTLQLLDDNYVTNIPENMIDNQFGMIGLLKLIQIDPSFETLAPGLNLASLGIVNWPSPGELHSVFTSPLTDQCMLRPHDMDYDVPPEYRIRSRIVGRLPADPPLKHLTDDVLFWIFYNCCREEAQLIAAKELYNREWRYHKKKMRWLTRVPGSEVIREGTSEQGTYYSWEPLTSEKTVQQLTIYYTDLDDTPTTYQLSSNTLNARVQTISQIYHQQQHTLTSSSSAGGLTYLGQTGRIPRPSVTAAKLPVISSMISNGPTIGVAQQMSSAKLKASINDSDLPLAVAASGSVTSNGANSIDAITANASSLSAS